MDTDKEIERLHGPIPELFDERGEAEFRELEAAVVAEALAADEPSVIALGGGAVTVQETRERLARRAFTVWVEIGVDLAWARVRGGKRPLAQDEASFRALYEQRADLYLETCDGVAENADDTLLESLQVAAEPGLLADLDWLVDGRPSALVADERVLGLHDPGLDGERHPVPSGETAKRLEVVAPLWDELGIGRDGVLVALGGGTTTDLAGFVAATYLRGIPWIAVPTSLVGQVDAAIGGKTGIDLAVGKNLAGAFHFPESVVIDTELLATLPEAERRQGMAEVVKTGLLAGRSYWELEEEQMVRATAAYKAGIVLSDPYERRPARDPEPRAHVRACARGGVGLRAGARRRGCARACSRRCASPGWRRTWSTSCSRRRRYESTATLPGRRWHETRRREAAPRGSCSWRRRAFRATTSSSRRQRSARRSIPSSPIEQPARSTSATNPAQTRHTFPGSVIRRGARAPLGARGERIRRRNATRLAPCRWPSSTGSI